jgi:hypothetical protein
MDWYEEGDPAVKLKIVGGMLAAVLAILLISCGSDDDRAETLSQASPPPSQSVASAPAATSSSTSAPTQAATSPPRGTPSEESVRAALLTLQDMPTGWTTDPTPSTDSGTDTLCNIPSAKQQRLVFADLDLQKSELGPFFSQTIGIYETGAAKKLMDDAVKILETCREWETTNSDGTKFTLKLAPMSFGKVGEQTFAFRMTGTSGGFPIQADVVYSREGDVLMVVTYLTVGLNAPDTTLTETLAKTGHDKIMKANLTR